MNRFRDEYRLILFHARPGVTDPASVKYRHESAILAACADPVDYYFRVIMPDKIRLQKAYLRERSVLGDFAVLARTLGACCHLESSHPRGEAHMPASHLPSAAVPSFRPSMVMSSRAAAPFGDRSPFPEFPVYMEIRHEGSFEATGWEMDAN